MHEYAVVDDEFVRNLFMRLSNADENYNVYSPCEKKTRIFADLYFSGTDSRDKDRFAPILR